MGTRFFNLPFLHHTKRPLCTISPNVYLRIIIIYKFLHICIKLRIQSYIVSLFVYGSSFDSGWMDDRLLIPLTCLVHWQGHSGKWTLIIYLCIFIYIYIILLPSIYWYTPYIKYNYFCWLYYVSIRWIILFVGRGLSRSGTFF